VNPVNPSSDTIGERSSPRIGFREGSPLRIEYGYFDVVSPERVNQHHHVKDFAFQTKLDYVGHVHAACHQKAMDALFSIAPQTKGVGVGKTMFVGRWYESTLYHKFLQALVETIFDNITDTEIERPKLDNELMKMGKYSADRAKTGPQKLIYESRNWKGIVGIHQSFHKGSKMSVLGSNDTEIVIQMRDSIQSHVVNTVILGFLVGTAESFDQGIYTGESRIEGRDVIFTIRKR